MKKEVYFPLTVLSIAAAGFQDGPKSLSFSEAALALPTPHVLPGQFERGSRQTNPEQGAIIRAIPEGVFARPWSTVVITRTTDFRNWPLTTAWYSIQTVSPERQLRFGPNADDPRVHFDGWEALTETQRKPAFINAWELATQDARGNLPGNLVEVWFPLECPTKLREKALQDGLKIRTFWFGPPSYPGTHPSFVQIPTQQRPGMATDYALPDDSFECRAERKAALPLVLQQQR